MDEEFLIVITEDLEADTSDTSKSWVSKTANAVKDKVTALKQVKLPIADGASTATIAMDLAFKKKFM